MQVDASVEVASRLGISDDKKIRPRMRQKNPPRTSWRGAGRGAMEQNLKKKKKKIKINFISKQFTH